MRLTAQDFPPEALRLFGLDQAEVSEHDILRGAALVRAGAA